MVKKSEKTIAEIQSDIRNFVDVRDWDKFHNPKDLSISLSLEAAEVMEHFQWKNEAEVADHVNKNRSEVADELADVLYYTLLIARKLNIDLSEAFDKKMIKNKVKYPVAKARGNNKKYTELNQ